MLDDETYFDNNGFNRSTTSRAIALATMNNPTSSSSESAYNVFISFRGPDVRKTFIGYLYPELCKIEQAQIFIDDRGIEPGDVIDDSLIKAIHKSRIALVIFSENYASSSYCLDELALIIERSIDQKRMFFLPVFYEVEPSILRHLKGKYEEALTKHEARFAKHEASFAKQKIHDWRVALKKAAGVSGFTSNKYLYDAQLIIDIAQSITKKISILREDDKNQITYNIEQPKAQTRTLKNQEVEHFSWRNHYNKDTKEQASASVYTSVPTNKILQTKTTHKYRDLTMLKVVFHQATRNDASIKVEIQTITLPTQSAVEDVINDLKSKVKLSHSGAELRLLGVSDHRIKKLFSHREKIENIINKYETIRAEEISEEEKNLGAEDKLVHVYHFNKVGEQIQNFGDPFFMVIKKDKKLIHIKPLIQKKLQIPYDEISKWKFASVRFNHDEDLKSLKGRDSVSDRFQRGNTYGDWEQYLGLEHS